MTERRGIRVVLMSKVVVTDPDGRVLVLRRSHTDPRRPLTWDLPGGLVDQGEDPNVTAQRELQEETGLTADTLTLKSAGSRNEGEYVIMLTYLAHTAATDIKLSFEHDQYRWIKPETVHELDMPAGYQRAVRAALSVE